MSEAIGSADVKRLRSLLGIAPGDVRFEESTLVTRHVEDKYHICDIDFFGSHGQKVPGCLLTPLGHGSTGPGLLYCHAHGNDYGVGRRELTEGRSALLRPYAADLAALGFSVLCLEMPCFGSRQDIKESAAAKACLWEGKSLFGQMLAELSAGIDYLCSMDSVDAERIGVAGFSMGGTHAYWLAALDDRIKACAHACCFCDLACLVAAGQHDGHGNYMTVPGLLAHCSTGALAGMIAPRAQLACVGLCDWSTPQGCFETARGELEDAYSRMDAASMLEFHVEEDAGHEETPEMRKRILAFLERRLLG